MKEICKGGNKRGLYGHMKMLIEKGKENDSNVKLMNEKGETIAGEKNVKDMIKSWGDLFCLKENTTYGVEKDLVGGGMNNEV